MLKPEVANEAGLHAVRAGIAYQHAVMSAYGLLAHLNLDCREKVGMLGELDDDGARELGEIARRGDLLFVGQPIHVGEMRAHHAEMLRRLVHALHERFLAPGHGLRDHDGDVVGRFDDEHLEPNVEGDPLALFQPEFARSLLRRLL